jgi:hypothetical protein
MANRDTRASQAWRGLAAAIDLLAARAEETGSQRLSLVAVGWATVDAERTLAEWGTDAELSPDADLERTSLGARAWLVDPAGLAIVVLEPSTEGRLAAALARHGEGPCALYVTAGASTVAPGGRRTALGRFGVLVRPPHPWGPFAIEVDDA